MLQHHLLWWIIVGFIAGVLAKALMPGTKREPTGCLYTICLGVGGSVIVGYVMRHFLHDSGGGGLIGSIIGATIGAMALIWIFRKIWQ